MKYSIDLHWDPKDDVWVAEVYDLPGCTAHGKTPHDATKSAVAAAKAWVEAAHKGGRAVPPPSAEDVSGTLLLRMPKTLHRNLRRRAAREGVSLNHLIVVALAGDEGAADQVRRKSTNSTERA